MFLQNRSCLIFICFLNLFLICLPCVSAQDKNLTLDPVTEIELKTPRIEPPKKAGTDAEKTVKENPEEKSTDLQNASPADTPIRTAAKQENDIEIITQKTERPDIFDKKESEDFATGFYFTGKRRRKTTFDNAGDIYDRKLSSPARKITDLPNETQDISPAVDDSFRWRSAIGQSLMFLGVQHGYAFTQLKTRQAIKGKFFKDYIKSVKSLHGWADGGRFFTNYVAHPMQGSFLGFIQVQNDPKGLKQQFGKSGDYWRSRLKAMAWSAAWSTQFEIGPISQASIGNVGLKGKQTYIDIVVTPTVGTAWLISEDAIDRFIMKRIERVTDNFHIKIFSRMLLNPTRTIANLFRLKTPWHRDRPREH